MEISLHKHLSNAQFFVRGDKVSISGGESQERIFKGFQALIDKVYVNLRMLHGVLYTEDDIVISENSNEALLGDDDSGGMEEAKRDILNYVRSQTSNGINVSVKHLTEKFSQKPYGWPAVATLCLTANLSNKGKILSRSGGTALEGKDLEAALCNSHALGNILLTLQTEFTPAQLQAAKELYMGFFDKPAEGADPRSLGVEWASEVQALSTELGQITNKKRDYPFLSVLEPLALEIQEMLGKPGDWYITEPLQKRDALLQAKDNILDKIRSFLSGPQGKIYSEARDFLESQKDNLIYLNHPSVEKIQEILQDPDCYKGEHMQNLKEELHCLKEALELVLQKERRAALDLIDVCRSRLEKLDDFQTLTKSQAAIILNRIGTLSSQIENASLIAVLRERGASVRDTLTPGLLAEIARFAKPTATPADSTVADNFSGETPESPALVNVNSLKISYPKLYLTDESDVDGYVSEMKNALLAEIRAGKKVII